MNSNKISGELKREILEIIAKDIVKCRKCGRLTEYRKSVSDLRKRAYKNEKYWGKAVPSFGDSQAKLLIIGLAPGAHGGNRTGRLFTGDSSGAFLFKSLFRFGFSNHPTSDDRRDGLKLIRTYITAVLHCVPPGNRPLPEEIENCRPYLSREFLALTRIKAVLTLGQVAFKEYLKLLELSGEIKKDTRLKFGHGVQVEFKNPLPKLFSSYHPSQQNTRTGKLTQKMFDMVLKQIRQFIDKSETEQPT